MKTFADEYIYKIQYHTDDTDKIVINEKSYLKSVRNGRFYQTKMTVDDLPEYFCDVNRYYGNHDCIKSIDVVDMKYSWVKENHFMKDSVLRISFTGKLNPYKPVYKYNEEEIQSCFTEYENVDSMVFGHDIFKFLGYAKKYSNYDLTEIRKEFIRQCEWLKENEPEFAPKGDFGECFDNNINEYIL